MLFLSLVVLFLDLFGLLFLIGKTVCAPLPRLNQFKQIYLSSAPFDETKEDDRTSPTNQSHATASNELVQVIAF